MGKANRFEIYQRDFSVLIGRMAESPGEFSNSLFEELADWNRQIKALSDLPDDLKGVVSRKGNPPCPRP